ncbi:MAG TPA: pyruvate kinase [Candidatus Hydrogenedentes bacterium]|nr:pyruvate kinase [Candidatus Hydrogenedentota bacterium]HPC14890.1 pyruvate kinase [Candidatus Hydrogenedentota bacterium]HRT18754.1 pyruvate kinase [Candidatus Hydrogenedentota bacterium]HRT63774.1 pyruvate kinase [Candidatus Hydrogenedentota bacterium]
MRRTKMVCTMGPSSDNPETIRELVSAGMDVARLNFSHGTRENHRVTLESIRAIAAELGRNVAILADLQGPKMRTGLLRGGGPVTLVEGAALCITTRSVPGDAACVSTTYANLPNDVQGGDRILLADGTMELRVVRVEGPDVHCSVVRGGALGQHKGINLPGVNVSAPSLTEKDGEDLAFAVAAGVDYVALSFVRKAGDIRLLRERLGRLCGGGPQPGVVAKIERPEALENFDRILPLCDAVMVARGDLGIEVDLNDVPQLQKQMIRKCNQYGIPVITATQMLESMMTSPTPTRAEVSDVANAIYDGTDAVMLSGETAAGRFPIEAARTMAAIAEKADAAIANMWTEHPSETSHPAVWGESPSDAVAEAAWHMAHKLPVSRIVCFTQSGFTARAIARYRPGVPITAITLTEATWRRCALIWGVEAIQHGEIEGVDAMLGTVDAVVRTHCGVRPGEQVIIVGGLPMAVGGITNFLKWHTIGEVS